jgi:putative ABC transport system substrate-binding protein
MDRRTFITNVARGLVAVPLATQAQQAGRVYRIGYLSAAAPAVSATVIDAFRQGLRERGWVEGKNFVIDYRFAEGHYDRLPDLAAELVRLNMDVIVAAPTPPAMAASKATRTIPIVMIGVNDPVGLRLVSSLARPGGNVTGLSYSVGQEIYGKQLALLKEVAPKAKRVAILWNPDVTSLTPTMREVSVAARSLELQLQPLGARDPAEFGAAFAAMAKERADGILVIVDPVFSLHRTQLAALAARSRLPAAYTNRQLVEAGGLMAYGPSFRDLWWRAAMYVDKILKGAKPADLPVEQPTKFELVINLKTAKALGLTIPPALVQRADEVIQ